MLRQSILAIIFLIKTIFNFNNKICKLIFLAENKINCEYTNAMIDSSVGKCPSNYI